LVPRPLGEKHKADRQNVERHFGDNTSNDSASSMSNDNTSKMLMVIKAKIMSFDKMSFDKMSFDKMSFDKMSFDKLSFDKMSFTLPAKEG
jgi:hypothetical protein